MTDISPAARKAAVDALYAARDSGKMMDAAAEAVALAVEPFFRAQIADEIGRAPRACPKDSSYAEGYADGLDIAEGLAREAGGTKCPDCGASGYATTLDGRSLGTCSTCRGTGGESDG